MTEQELIDKQEKGNNETLYLMKVGMFFHAYGAGAFALARTTGYRIKRKSRKGGREMLVAGFPAESLNAVVAKLEAAGATVTRHSDILVEVAGLDGTPDEGMVDTKISDAATDRPDTAWKKRIMEFDLGNSTPLAAMNLLAELQREMR